MDKKPNISEAEWEVMRLLWRKHPQTGNELAEPLCDTRQWQPKTVKTLLSRLLTKGVIGYQKKGRQYSYYPKLKEKACVQRASRHFLQRVFGGAVTPMLAALIEEKALSDQDIRELKAMLDGETKE